MSAARKKKVYRPRRRLGHELSSLLPMLALPVAIFLVFPGDAVGPVEEAARRESAPSCSIVELEPAVEAKAVELVRSALSVNARSVRNLRADLSLSTVEEGPPEPVMDIADRHRPARPGCVKCEVLPLPPSVAAPEAASLPETRGDEAPAFPREELLNID